MKLKNSYFYTLRENVKDEDSLSGNLLVRSGMIKKNSSIPPKRTKRNQSLFFKQNLSREYAA